MNDEDNVNIPPKMRPASSIFTSKASLEGPEPGCCPFAFELQIPLCADAGSSALIGAHPKQAVPICVHAGCL